PVRDHLGIASALLTGDSWDAVLASATDRFEVRDQDPATLASLLYTSGTTGQSKGVMLTHRNIVDNALHFSEVHFGPDDRLLIAAPLFHCWGLINGALGTFAAGGPAIVVRRFQTGPVLDLIESARPTAMLGVPTMYNYMSKSQGFSNRDLSSLRFVLS